MIFYINQDVEKAKDLTELSLDEIETVVGRFTKQSSRAGQLRGEVIAYIDGDVVIRHHFTKKILWRSK